MLHPHEAQQGKGEVRQPKGGFKAAAWHSCLQHLPCWPSPVASQPLPAPQPRPHIQGSIYAALAKVAPYGAPEEESRRAAQYNYWWSGARAMCATAACSLRACHVRGLL
jgi:hypothetical protein